MKVDVDLNFVAGSICASVAAIAIAWAPVACTSSNNAKIAEAVNRGVNPIEAKCAYSSAGSENVACAIMAAKSKQKDEK